MKAMALLFIGMWVASTAFADDKEVQKYRNYTPQQLERLDEKVQNSEVPMMFIFAARKGLSKGAELRFAMDLNVLMYSGVHDYPTAVKAFQADLGEAPTGVLTVWQIHQLEQRSEMQKLSRVLFPDNFISFKQAGYATVEGTLTIIDDRIAWPINHVNVQCYKDDGYCQLSEMDLAVPNKNSWT
jgi:hypothetical protein